MRCVFSRQLIVLFSQHDALLKEFENERLGESIKAMNRTYKRGPFSCLSIVREDLNLACDLDILFLRREAPGSLISSGGDIDNRLKVLFDALRVPQDDNEVRGIEPGEDVILACLTEDDKLITGFRVTTDTLLEPPPSEAEQNHVQLVINVEVKATKLTERNLAYFAHF
jgi:hypothetical protein